MKLRWFTRGLLGIAVLILLERIFFKVTDQASGYFGLTLILFVSGLELVRAELAELRRTITAKDEQ